MDKRRRPFPKYVGRRNKLDTKHSEHIFAITGSAKMFIQITNKTKKKIPVCYIINESEPEILEI